MPTPTPRPRPCSACGAHEGVLVDDDEPSFTVYRMEAPDEDGVVRHTTGVIGALELSRPGEGGILPHEFTTPKAKSDRLDLLRSTVANLSPVWGLSPAAGLTELLECDDRPSPTSRPTAWCTRCGASPTRPGSRPSPPPSAPSPSSSPTATTATRPRSPTATSAGPTRPTAPPAGPRRSCASWSSWSTTSSASGRSTACSRASPTTSTWWPPSSRSSTSSPSRSPAPARCDACRPKAPSGW